MVVPGVHKHDARITEPANKCPTNRIGRMKYFGRPLFKGRPLCDDAKALLTTANPIPHEILLDELAYRAAKQFLPRTRFDLGEPQPQMREFPILIKAIPDEWIFF